VFFGDEERLQNGTTRITRNIFAGTNDRNENAMLFLDNLNKIKQTKRNSPMGISGVRKLGYNDINDEMMSQASCPTDLDTTFNSFGQAPPRREVFNSNSGFESLDPVYEEPDSVD